MTEKPDTTVRNSSGGIDGYTNDYGIFVWGNPTVMAENARRADLLEAAQAIQNTPSKDKEMER